MAWLGCLLLHNCVFKCYNDVQRIQWRLKQIRRWLKLGGARVKIYKMKSWKKWTRTHIHVCNFPIRYYFLFKMTLLEFFKPTLLRCLCCSYVDVLLLLSCYYVLLILLYYLLVLKYCYYHILIVFLLLLCLCYCLHEIYKEVIITWTTWLVGLGLIQHITTG
jgi:hypothetical protein